MKLTELQKTEIKENIADKLGLDRYEVLDESEVRNDLGADSLDEVELVMELEKMFNISIPDEEYGEIDNVKISDLFELVQSKLS